MPPAQLAQAANHPHKRGELIVKFKQNIPRWQRDQVVEIFAKAERELRGRSRLTKLQLKDHLNVATTLLDLRQLNAVVEYVEPNYIVAPAGKLKIVRRAQGLPGVPNDPQFNAQWALANTGQNNGVPGADIGALAGWQKTTGARDTIIAVIDTGVDINHPDLNDNLWRNRREASGERHQDDDRDGYVDNIAGWNFVNDSPDVRDNHGHGTAMAGIIAAEGNNNAGITGAMWSASIMPLKALDATGSGTISDVVEAMDFATAHGASIINCSFGTDGFSQSLLDAINRAATAGALIVASAGNNSRDLTQTPYTRPVTTRPI